VSKGKTGRTEVKIYEGAGGEIGEFVGRWRSSPRFAFSCTRFKENGIRTYLCIEEISWELSHNEKVVVKAY